eukprot:COSAG05_NODE_904_length_6658_cov_17.747065_2_plen_143_part_00
MAGVLYTLLGVVLLDAAVNLVRQTAGMMTLPLAITLIVVALTWLLYPSAARSPRASSFAAFFFFSQPGNYPRADKLATLCIRQLMVRTYFLILANVSAINCFGAYAWMGAPVADVVMGLMFRNCGNFGASSAVLAPAKGDGK